jgi:prevent-host-death family protein
VAEVSIRDLRNRGGEVIERVRRGERLTITSDGRPVAELSPLPRTPMSLDVLIEQMRLLPPVDPQRLRRDLDAIIDFRL